MTSVPLFTELACRHRAVYRSARVTVQIPDRLRVEAGFGRSQAGRPLRRNGAKFAFVDRFGARQQAGFASDFRLRSSLKELPAYSTEGSCSPALHNPTVKGKRYELLQMKRRILSSTFAIVALGATAASAGSVSGSWGVLRTPGRLFVLQLQRSYYQWRCRAGLGLHDCPEPSRNECSGWIHGGLRPPL